MNKQLIATGITAVLTGTLCSIPMAIAQKTEPQTGDPDDANSVTANAIGGADAPSVRLAALIRANVNGSVDVFRSKGVASVTRPEVGTICIKPSSTTLNVTNIIPTVSVDFSKSATGNNLVEYRSSPPTSICPGNNIGIRTFVLRNNPTVGFIEKVPDDVVAFTIVVP